MKLTEAHLRAIIQEELETEQLKNLHSKHEATVDSDPEGTKKKLWKQINSNLGKATSSD